MIIVCAPNRTFPSSKEIVPFPQTKDLRNELAKYLDHTKNILRGVRDGKLDYQVPI